VFQELYKKYEVKSIKIDDCRLIIGHPRCICGLMKYFLGFISLLFHVVPFETVPFQHEAAYPLIVPLLEAEVLF
jgi:hypothetical protein